MPRKAQRKRRRNRPRNRRNRSSARQRPQSNVYRTVVRSVWDIGDPTAKVPISTTEKTIDIGYVLAAPNASYSKTFAEMKIIKMTTTYVPYNSSTDEGVCAASITDFDEVRNSNTFNNIISGPGSFYGKMSQRIRLVWRPTEPADRNWITLISDHKYAKYRMACVPRDALDPYTKAVVFGICGKVIVDTQLIFRGVSSAFSDSLPSEKCICVKCMRRRNFLSVNCVDGELNRTLGDNLNLDSSSEASPFNVISE